LCWGLTLVRSGKERAWRLDQALLFFLDFLLFLPVFLTAFFLVGVSALGVAAGAGVGATAGVAVTAGATAGAGAGAAVWAMAVAASKLARSVVMDLIMRSL